MYFMGGENNDKLLPLKNYTLSAYLNLIGFGQLRVQGIESATKALSHSINCGDVGDSTNTYSNMVIFCRDRGCLFQIIRLLHKLKYILSV